VSLTSNSKLVQSRSVVRSVWAGSVKLHARCASCSVSTSVSSASIIPPTLHILLHLDIIDIRPICRLDAKTFRQSKVLSDIRGTWDRKLLLIYVKLEKLKFHFCL